MKKYSVLMIFLLCCATLGFLSCGGDSGGGGGGGTAGGDLPGRLAGTMIFTPFEMQMIELLPAPKAVAPPQQPPEIEYGWFDIDISAAAAPMGMPGSRELVSFSDEVEIVIDGSPASLSCNGSYDTVTKTVELTAETEIIEYTYRFEVQAAYSDGSFHGTAEIYVNDTLSYVGAVNAVSLSADSGYEVYFGDMYQGDSFRGQLGCLITEESLFGAVYYDQSEARTAAISGTVSGNTITATSWEGASTFSFTGTWDPSSASGDWSVDYSDGGDADSGQWFASNPIGVVAD